MSFSLASKDYKICCHCIMDMSDPHIVFDDRGRCDYCNNFDATIKPNWDTSARGLLALHQIAESVRADDRGRDFDCIIGLSGDDAAPPTAAGVSNT